MSEPTLPEGHLPAEFRRRGGSVHTHLQRFGPVVDHVHEATLVRQRLDGLPHALEPGLGRVVSGCSARQSSRDEQERDGRVAGDLRHGH